MTGRGPSEAGSYRPNTYEQDEQNLSALADALGNPVASFKSANDIFPNALPDPLDMYEGARNLLEGTKNSGTPGLPWWLLFNPAKTASDVPPDLSNNFGFGGPRVEGRPGDDGGFWNGLVPPDNSISDGPTEGISPLAAALARSG
jgi:hypothetical protein